MNTSRTLIIVPAWNEGESVGNVVSRIRQTAPYADVLVVNDGSTDRTGEVASAAGAHVLNLPINLGVGGAMRAGFQYAVQKSYDVAVQIDADGQHDPTDLPRLLDRLSNGADIVIGARFAGVGNYEARGPRRWAMKVLARMISAYGRGEKLTDVTSGYKAYSKTAIQLFSRNYPAEYLGDTIEALIIAFKSGLRVEQIPVEMHERMAGTPSHSPFKAALYLFRALISMSVAIIAPVQKVR